MSFTMMRLRHTDGHQADHIPKPIRPGIKTDEDLGLQYLLVNSIQRVPNSFKTFLNIEIT